MVERGEEGKNQARLNKNAQQYSNLRRIWGPGSQDGKRREEEKDRGMGVTWDGGYLCRGGNRMLTKKKGSLSSIYIGAALRVRVC